MPVSRQTALQEQPWVRRDAILEASTATLGLPSLLPLALAFLMPARTRSAIRLRSSSATAPSTVKTILPVGVLVSTCSETHDPWGYPILESHGTRPSQPMRPIPQPSPFASAPRSSNPKVD